jgi:hypothetical protein
MRYIPLDNIGLRKRDRDGNLTNINEPGNNYPANEMGLPKSTFVFDELDNIVLRGIYEENEVKYPLLDPVKANIVPVPETNFRFIVNLGAPTAYTSQGMYEDLIKAYEERNPWFSIRTVPNINLDTYFLKQYSRKNKFKVTEAYCEMSVTSSFDNNDEFIFKYIDWLVSRDVGDIELKPIDELGNREYVEDGDLGIGLKSLYDSMIKEDEPEKEAIGVEILREEYSLELPEVLEVSGFLQPLPDEEIVPKLVDAILSERVPPGKQLYKPFGPVGFQVLGAVIAVAATLASFGALAPVIAGITGTVTGTVLGTAAAGSLVSLTPKGLELLDKAIRKASGSWVEYILKRSTTRQPFQRKRIVFNKEREDDLNEWNNLLLAAKGQMGVTKYTEVQVRAALAIIFAQFGPNVKSNDLSYPIEVGNEIKRLQVIPTSDRKVNLILK